MLFGVQKLKRLAQVELAQIVSSAAASESKAGKGASGRLRATNSEASEAW